ncbi:MAG: homoserine kinase [Oscillospiraceae bacterium]
MVKIRIPATSANMGPGYDSMGVALALYNYVTVEETGKGLKIDILDDTCDFLATDERNLVYKAMMKVFDRVGYSPKGLHITLENGVPVTRGLGSSSAGIVGGLMAANALTGRKLSQNTLLNMAADMEGHPDNVSPALLGGFTVNVMQHKHVEFVKTCVKDDLRFVAFVPNFFLQTKRSRSILPRSVSHNDAVYNAGRSALLTASLVTGKYENIRTAIGDKLHQRYRRRLIPYMDNIFKMCYQNGALGVYLSGAGPTIVAIIKTKNTRFVINMSKVLNTRLKDWKMHILKVDNNGATICE